MNETHDVVQKIREHLDRQVRTGDRLKAELTEAFSAAAEGLIEQQSAELISIADVLRQRSDGLSRLLEAVPQTEARIADLLASAGGFLGKAEALALRLESDLARIDETCQKNLQQSLRIFADLGSLAKNQEQRLEGVSKLLEFGFSTSRKTLGEIHSESMKRQELGSARLLSWMTAVDTRLKDLEEAGRRRDDTLRSRLIAGFAVLLLAIVLAALSP